MRLIQPQNRRLAGANARHVGAKHAGVRVRVNHGRAGGGAKARGRWKNRAPGGRKKIVRVPGGGRRSPASILLLTRWKAVNPPGAAGIAFSFINFRVTGGECGHLARTVRTESPHSPSDG